jgi:hypothetical protein
VARKFWRFCAPRSPTALDKKNISPLPIKTTEFKEFEKVIKTDNLLPLNFLTSRRLKG